jgi:hypothetical protein
MLASGAYFTLPRFTSLSRRDAGKTVAGGIGVLAAAIVGYSWFALGGEAAAFIALAFGGTTLVRGVIPVGLGYFALSRLTDTDAPLTHAVAGWSPSLAVPVAVAYLFGLPPAPALWAVLAVPFVGPAAIGCAVHRLRSR